MEAAIGHADEGGFDGNTVWVGIPSPNQQPTVRFDRDVVERLGGRALGFSRG